MQRDLVPGLEFGELEFEFDLESGDEVGVAMVISGLKQYGRLRPLLGILFRGLVKSKLRLFLNFCLYISGKVSG